MRKLLLVVSHSLLVLLCIDSRLGSAAPRTDVQTSMSKGYVAVLNEDLEQAKNNFERALKLTTPVPGSIEGSNDRWSALMAVAWIESLRGKFDRSIELSTEALDVATRRGNQFMIGRSLCWIGWSFSATGRYEAARLFYEKAAAIGAPEGKIIHPSVWGLAKQELGYIAFKTGDGDTARKLLNKTLDYAREHEILIGISESATALAQVALAAGNFQEAESLSDEAVEAAYKCSCNPENTARALIIKAQSALRQAGESSSKRLAAHADLERALTYAREHHLRAAVAEALIILASDATSGDPAGRLSYANEALEIVKTNNLETKALAYLTAADTYLENKSPELAAQYVRNGMEISAKTLRVRDLSRLLTTEAVVAELRGDGVTAIKSLLSAIELARTSGDLPLLMASQIKLSNMYLEAGATVASLKTASSALETIEKLEDRSSSKEAHASLQAQRLAIADRIVRLSISINPVAATAPVSEQG